MGFKNFLQKCLKTRLQNVLLSHVSETQYAYYIGHSVEDVNVIFRHLYE